MSLIVDASIAVKWLADEPKSAEARALAAESEALIAPELIISEVGNALWKKYRKRLVTRAQAIAGVQWLSLVVAQLQPNGSLAVRAVELALDLNHPIYDCFYLALALDENATLVTADARMAAAAKKARVKVRML
jgi:predicted nucleic acid-binding protein